MITVTRNSTVTVTVPSRPVVGVKMAYGGAGGEPYAGEYEITPTTSEQTLATKRKLLRDDVTVHSIPYVETTNEQGGFTVSIAS